MKENNKIIGQKIKRAVESSTPDILPEILHYMHKKERGSVNMTDIHKNQPSIEISFADHSSEQNTKFVAAPESKPVGNSKAKGARRIISLAAAFLLFFALQAAYSYYMPESIINFDVNPSIEIKVNSREKVLAVNPLNGNAQDVIGDMNLKNIDLDIAVNALIGSMVKNGYLSTIKNSILVSVDTKNKDKGAQLEERLSKGINDLLHQYAVKGAILSQNITEKENLKILAQQYDISLGKAALIEAFVSIDDTMAFNDLAQLSINDLSLLAEDKFSALKEINKIGEANDAYIGKERAKAIALQHAGISEDSLNALEIEMDYEKNRLIYEVEFNTFDTKYEYEIDALTGEILDIEREGKSKPLKTPASKQGEKGSKPSSSTQYIGSNAAKNIALKHAGLKEKNVGKLEVELEKEDGIMVYEVEFKFSGYEYKYEVNAITGQIVEWKKEID